MPCAAASLRHAARLGVLAGLAAASKFHYGIWLLLPLAVFWLGAPRETPGSRQRLIATFALVAGFMVTLMAFVPWFWTNPPLALKEFTGVVLAKAAGGTRRTASLLSNGSTVFVGLGVADTGGRDPGLPSPPAPTRCARRLPAGGDGPVGGNSVRVSHRLRALWPGDVARPYPYSRRRVAVDGRAPPDARPRCADRPAGQSGLYQSVKALDEFRHRNSYHLAHEWMIAHLPDRASVVIYSEDNQFLPRTPDQLGQCEAYVETDAAYREKWLTNGVQVPADSGRPMRRAVLNDELFHAYLCARERLAPQSPAFVVHRFHPDRRFQTLDVPTLEREFRAGLSDPTRGFDAVLVHWPLFADLQAGCHLPDAPGAEAAV